MDLIYLIIIIFTLGTFSKVATSLDPVIRTSERAYYTQGESITKLAGIIDQLTITEETNIQDEISKLKNPKLQVLSEGEDDTFKPRKKDKGYVLPLITFEEQVYNIIIDETKTKINELEYIGEFKDNYGDYSNDKRLKDYYYLSN